MTMTGWTQRDKSVFYNEAPDVSVQFVPTMDGRPFQATIGESVGYFPYLIDALDWCEEACRGREMVVGAVTLLHPQSIDDVKFLADRGLNR